MKKFIFISLGILLIIAGIVAGYFITTRKDNKEDISIKELAIEENIEDDCIDEEAELEDIISAIMQEIKVSPNTVLLIKKYHKECGHTTKEYVEAPVSIVNKNKEEVQEVYKDWEIEIFSEKDITILREFEGICDEHYIVKEADGFITIYYLDSNDKENLLEVTGISTEYLPEEDLTTLKEGIRVNGKEELNAIIEDFE